MMSSMCLFKITVLFSTTANRNNTVCNKYLDKFYVQKMKLLLVKMIQYLQQTFVQAMSYFPLLIC